MGVNIMGLTGIRPAQGEPVTWLRCHQVHSQGVSGGVDGTPGRGKRLLRTTCCQRVRRPIRPLGRQERAPEGALSLRQGLPIAGINPARSRPAK